VNYDALLGHIATLHALTTGSAAAAVNQALLVRNWLMGAWIVEFEQFGADRATYGSGLLKRLAKDLRASGLRGVSPDLLERMRGFYRVYPQLWPAISATASRNSLSLPGSTVVAMASAISATSRKSSGQELPLLPAEAVFRLTWSHLVELLRLDDPWKRAFYENETLRASSSVRELQRQIGSLLYERTGLSTDKKAVIAAARAEASLTKPLLADLLRDPYVLEFTGLAERSHYRETDLESALLDHLQTFLLELGTGFCFEARQKRITVGNEHDWIDLVFYHRVLRCHLLVDLKVRAFTHGDAGQMNFYLNWWRDHMLVEGDQAPVGLVLCSDKDETKVHYATAGLDHQLFVSRYLVALPSPEDLQRLVEADRALLEQLPEDDKEPQ
jgi:predicted nuclease of restriction endonuclease-like (RecB) superfamily